MYEHIFIDWFSNDWTVDIINSYINNSTWNNIRLIQAHPMWIYNAMNIWLKNAIWDYVIFLNSDDYLEENVLYDYIKFINNTWNLDLYYSKLRFVDFDWIELYVSPPDRTIYKKWLNKFVLGCMNYVFHPTVIYKRWLHDKYWFYNETLKISSDYEFEIILAWNKVSNIFYDKIITNFRTHNESASSWANSNEKMELENNYILDKYYWSKKYLIRLIRWSYKVITKCLKKS